MTEEEKYKFLIEASNTAYVILDLNLKVLDANQLYVSAFGFDTVQDIIGYDIRPCVNADNLEIFNQAFNKILNGEKVQDVEIELTNRDKEYVAIRLSGSIIENGDKKIFCLVKFISEMKQRQKTKIKNREKCKIELQKDLQSFIKCIDNS